MSSRASNAGGIRPVRASGAPVKLLASVIAGCICANVFTLVFHWRIWSSVLVGILVAYLPSYMDSSHLAVSAAEGSRFWPGFALWPGWARLFRYFPASVRSEEYDYAKGVNKGGQFVWACHPHGHLSLSHALIFTDCAGFMSKVAPLPRRDIGASVIFSIPGLRELVLWLGVVDAGSPTVRNVLSQGYSMQLYPGGLQEQLASSHTQPIVVAKQRTGFIRLALQYDVPIVPIYIFGEDRLYTSINLFRGLRQKIVSTLRVCISLYYGRSDRLFLAPHKVPLVAVVGKPLWPEGVNESTQARDHAAMLASKREAGSKPAAAGSARPAKVAPLAVPSGSPGVYVAGRRQPREVSTEEVNAMHDRYVEALEKLFEENKGKMAGYENATLQVRSARG